MTSRQTPSAPPGGKKKTPQSPPSGLTMQSRRRWRSHGGRLGHHKPKLSQMWRSLAKRMLPFSSITSICSMVRPARARTFLAAGTGRSPMTRGSTPAGRDTKQHAQSGSARACDDCRPDAISIAAPPSFNAQRHCPQWNGQVGRIDSGASLVSASIVVPGRGFRRGQIQSGRPCAAGSRQG